DVFYIAGYVFFIMFLVLYVRQIKQKITKNLLLFSTIISFVFLLPALYVLGDYYQDEPILSISVALVYPILSSAMLFFVLLGIMFFAKGEHTYFWTLIFVGFLIHTVTDTLFLFTAIDDSYYDGHVSDLLYLIG
ncbi:MAG: two-component sensor histidine kinase, partial [Nitrosopumilales archaeon CG15_BIG_FIL_POST_REV_8_21_14_020_37_12]